MSRLPEEARFRVGGRLAHAVARGLFSTVRFEVEDPDGGLLRGGPPVVVVAWHDQLLPLVHVLRNRGLVALVSEHADGEFLARALERYGFGTVRGSSTRGGARGLRELLRATREGRGLALTPDGPRGPRHRFKEGALMAAQLSELPVLPVAGAASSAWRFGSWDRFMLPRPFSSVRVVCGPPTPVPRTADRDGRRRLARELEDLLEELTIRAARGVGTEAPSGDEVAPGSGGPQATEELEPARAPEPRGREEGRAPMA